MKNNNGNSSSVRVRFAPSPTGHLHIGGLRTALFNWLFARHNNGSFLLRIEDTDLERSKDEYTKAIYEAFSWVGITSDEKPLIQSQRFEIYKAVGKHLLDIGSAYWCSCTQDEVEDRVRSNGFVGEYHGGYDGYCRTRKNLQTSQSALRFLVVQEGASFAWNDAIRGMISFERDQIDDFIIIRSDGTPTYNFCVVIDDNVSSITHVIRGEDHISNTPKQIALYEALEYEVPIFGHIPMILGPDGNKLSKRDGAVDVVAYRTMGYLPQALINYIVRLGWSYGDQEIFTQEELIKYFSLESVGKKPSVFDYAKLAWLNGLYMRHLDAQDLLSLILELKNDFCLILADWSQERIYLIINLYKERSETLCQLIDFIVGLYNQPERYNEKDLSEYINSDSIKILTTITQEIELLSSLENISDVVKNFCKKHNLKLAVVAQPIRIALTGSASSPGVFDIMKILEKQEVVYRLKKLINY